MQLPHAPVHTFRRLSACQRGHQRRHQRRHQRDHQRGLTLVELMVSMVIALLIALAAAAALFVSRRGYGTVDAATQLRENSRFASDLLQRLVSQAGYESCEQGCSAASAQLSNPLAYAPSIVGFENGRFSAPGGNGDTDDSDVATGGATNGRSDVLVLRFQGASAIDGTPDGSIVNCAGVAEPALVDGQPNRAISVLHVAPSPSDDNEPNLMCSYRGVVAGRQGNWTTQPLVSGVESMQVLYGIDTDNPADGTPNRYVSATELNVADRAERLRRWAQVSSVKVGLVMRSARKTAQDQAGTARTYYPLGGGDPDSSLTVAAADAAEGRIRHTVSFTAFVRNRPE